MSKGSPVAVVHSVVVVLRQTVVWRTQSHSIRAAECSDEVKLNKITAWSVNICYALWASGLNCRMKEWNTKPTLASL